MEFEVNMCGTRPGIQNRPYHSILKNWSYVDLSVEAKEAGAFFNSFIVDLLRLFSTDRELLEYRGSFIIRHLSTFVNAEKLYRALAGNLLQEEDLEFANRMVQNLNLILLTSPELHQLRADLYEIQPHLFSPFFFVFFFLSISLFIHHPSPHHLYASPKRMRNYGLLSFSLLFCADIV